MSLSDKQWEFLKDFSLLISFCDRKGIKVTGGELYRTEYQQKEYIKKGLSKTMKSKHLKRLAIDLNFFIKGKYVVNKKELQFIGDFWESLNPKNKWGGNFNQGVKNGFIDTPHFEREE
jgi:hypothetical protein